MQALGGQELEGASKSHDLALREGQGLAGAGLSKDAQGSECVWKSLEARTNRHYVDEESLLVLMSKVSNPEGTSPFSLPQAKAVSRA